jgi:hypothetical protein
MIMHNMVVENERAKNEIYGMDDLMGQPVWPCRGGDRVTHFFDAYHNIRDSDMHGGLQKDLIQKW